MFLEEKFFRQIVRSVPIVCVDVVVEDNEGSFLLVKRAADPLKNIFWPVGGRKFLGESVRQAAERILVRELGVGRSKYVIDDEYSGIYWDQFESSSFGSHRYETISLVVKAKIVAEAERDFEFDESISDFGFFTDLPKRFQKRTKWLIDNDSLKERSIE